MFAAAYSDTISSLETVKLLIASGAKVNLQNKDGDTALMLAALAAKQNSTSSLETVKVLIDAGTMVDLKNNDGDTAYNLCQTNACRHLFRANVLKKILPRDPISIIMNHHKLPYCDVEYEIDIFARDIIQIDTTDSAWTSASKNKKCWLAKNMITLDKNPYRLQIAIINYDAAIAQGKLKEFPNEYHELLEIDKLAQKIEKNRRDRIERIGKPQFGQLGRGRIKFYNGHLFY
jgi:hypothetical protein